MKNLIGILIVWCAIGAAGSVAAAPASPPRPAAAGAVRRPPSSFADMRKLRERIKALHREIAGLERWLAVARNEGERQVVAWQLRERRLELSRLERRERGMRRRGVRR